MRLNNFKKNEMIITYLLIILSAIFLILLSLFVIPINKFDCDKNVCKIYEKLGFLGSEYPIEIFNRIDIKSYSIEKCQVVVIMDHIIILN